MFRLFIVERYIFKELSLSVVAVVTVLLLIFGGIRFLHFLGYATEGKVPGGTIFALSAYQAISALMLLLPLAALIAVILVLGRMANDNETIALLACGVSRGRFLRVVLTFGLASAAVVGFISLYLGPLASAKGYRLKQWALLAAETSGLVAGSFKEINHGQWVFYAESLTANRMGMKNIFIRAQEPRQKIIFRAARGHLTANAVTGDKHLILEDGYRYDFAKDGSEWRKTHFALHGILIKKGGEQEFRTRHKTLPTLVLWEMGGAKDMAIVQWRLSMPIATLLLVMLAVPLARSGPRQGRYAGLVPAILGYVIYSNMLGIARNWLAREIIPSTLGLWWIHGLMLLVVLGLLWPQPVRYLLRPLRLLLIGAGRQSPALLRRNRE